MITSIDNDKVRYIRALAERKGRRSAKAFAVEGIRVVGDALLTGRIPRTVLYDPQAMTRTPEGQRLLEELQTLAPKALFAADAKVVQTAGDTVTSQGIIAAFDLFTWSETDLANRPLQVVLDGIQDPGNLGTMLRTAAAAGNCGLWLMGGAAGAVDPFSPKAVRAGMGAQFRVPFVDDVADWAALGEAFTRLGLPAPDGDPTKVVEDAAVWLADGEADQPEEEQPQPNGATIVTSRSGQRKWVKPQQSRKSAGWDALQEVRLNATDIFDIDWRGRQAVIIGNEANGPSEEARLFAHRIAHATSGSGAGRVYIPMPGGFESLNAATAASLIIYEALRQST